MFPWTTVDHRWIPTIGTVRLTCTHMPCILGTTGRCTTTIRILLADLRFIAVIRTTSATATLRRPISTLQ